MTICRLATAILVCSSLAACGASGGGDDYQPPPNGNGARLDIDGDYRVVSEFTVTAEQLGASSDFIVDLENLADDPVEEIARMIADEFGVGVLAGELEDYLEEAMGEDAQDIANAIHVFLDAALKFDIVSTMKITESSSKLEMTHQLTALHMNIDDEDVEFEFEGIKADQLEKYGLTRSGTTIDRASLNFASHEVDIPYAQMLETAIDELLIPNLIDGEGDLGTALADAAKCDVVGTKIAEEIGFNASFWEGLCESALDAVARELISKIGEIDSLRISVMLDGRATATDASGNGRADKFTGAWDSAFFGDLNKKVDTPFEATRITRTR